MVKQGHPVRRAQLGDWRTASGEIESVGRRRSSQCEDRWHRPAGRALLAPSDAPRASRASRASCTSYKWW